MNNYVPRLSISYADASGVINAWAEQCDKLIVYEHEKDSKVPTTHIHLLMMGCKVKEERLKRIAKGLLPASMDIHGNAFWKWTSKHPADEGFITYMSKGKLVPKYSKNILESQIEERRTAWVEPSGSLAPPKEKYDEYEELKKDFMKRHNYWTTTFDETRKWTMRWYYERDGRLPHCGNYKRNAASLFYMASLHPQSPAEDALEEIKNLWY